MRFFPASHSPARLGIADSLSQASAPSIPQRSRAFWFALGFFAALTVAGFVAGIFHLPA